MSSRIATSFVATKENFQFLGQFSNRSKFLNALITKTRKEAQKQDILKQYNNLAESDEMNEWVDIANNFSNLS